MRHHTANFSLDHFDNDSNKMPENWRNAWYSACHFVPVCMLYVRMNAAVKVDLKRWIMYFHIIQKWNQQSCAPPPPQFTKPCCIYIHVISLLSKCMYMHFSMKKREKSLSSSKMPLLPLQNIRIYLIRFDKSFVRKNIWSHLFIYITPPLNGRLYNHILIGH